MFQQVYFIVFGIAVASARHAEFYRRDYTYLEEHDAFYKLHYNHNHTTWSSTFLACDDEGSELFYPTTANEWMVAKNLVRAMMTEGPNITDIYVGIHDKFGLGEYMTVNGHPSTISIQNSGTESDFKKCVTMEIDTGNYKGDLCSTEPGTPRPFICKKVEDVTCPTIDKGYKYIKETRKCYKLNNKPKTWFQAIETCFMEGGILLVLGSEMEADIVNQNFVHDDTYYVGFKKQFFVNDFYTVKGQKLQDSGFERWYSDEYRNQYECGVLVKYDSRLYMKAVTCDNELPFLCEMEVAA